MEGRGWNEAEESKPPKVTSRTVVNDNTTIQPLFSIWSVVVRGKNSKTKNNRLKKYFFGAVCGEEREWNKVQESKPPKVNSRTLLNVSTKFQFPSSIWS